MSWPTTPDGPGPEDQPPRPAPPPPPPPPPPPAPPGYTPAGPTQPDGHPQGPPTTPFPPAPPTQGYPPAGYPQAPPTQAYPSALGYPQGPPSQPGYPAAYPQPFPSGQPQRVVSGDGGRKALLAVAMVLALLAGGFAIVNLSAGSQTGATTPEGAVEQLFDSIDDEDLIGVLEVLDPGERDLMVPFVRRLASELARLEITSDMDLENVPGLDLEVEGLQLGSQELADGIAEVTITGGVIRFATEPEAVPVGEVLQDIVEANGGRIEVPRQQDQAPLGGEGMFLVATENGGRWHLSLAFTIAEYARRDAGHELPDLTAGVTPQGAASAEDAVREFVDAATALDLERMISLLPPDEMRALQAYAPLFLEEAQEDADEFRYDEDFDVTVDNLELDTTPVGNSTRVVPTAGTFTMDGDDGETTVSYADGCIEVSGAMAPDFVDEFGESEVCSDELAATSTESMDEDDEAELRALGELFAGFEPGVMVVEREGKFYVDPLRTVGDLAFQAFEGIEAEDLQEGGILYRLFTGELFDSGFDYYPGPDYSDLSDPTDGCDVWDSETGDG